MTKRAWPGGTKHLVQTFASVYGVRAAKARFKQTYGKRVSFGAGRPRAAVHDLHIHILPCTCGSRWCSDCTPGAYT